MGTERAGEDDGEGGIGRRHGGVGAVSEMTVYNDSVGIVLVNLIWWITRNLRLCNDKLATSHERQLFLLLYNNII